MNMLSRVFGRREDRPKTNTVTNPLRIARPVAGFVCLEPEFQALMEADKASLSPFFSQVRSSSDGIVTCDVLFLYCKVDRDGSLPASTMRIRDFVKASGARVAIVASENVGAHYLHALQPKNDWPANFVLVFNRHDTAFTVFFRRLFAAMKDGTSMLMAWVNLAPQDSGRSAAHQECPGTIMIAEAGHITFDG